MARPYSMDLRDRVVAAVERDGMSCHAAAARFEVGVSTAIKWMQRYRQTGSAAPGQMGGHKPRAIVGAHRDWLIARCRGGAFTLRGLVAELAERGLKVDYRSVWSFFHAEKLSFKKNRARQRAGSS
jgi:putative transposase